MVKKPVTKKIAVSALASSKSTAFPAASNVPAAVETPATEGVSAKVIVPVKRKEMVERIAARSGVKPNQIKNVLDAILQELGDALSNGEVVDLQPLGKIRVNRQKDLPNAEVLICKLRRKKVIEKVTTELAE